jgi:hypothetical protein
MKEAAGPCFYRLNRSFRPESSTVNEAFSGEVPTPSPPLFQLPVLLLTGLPYLPLNSKDRDRLTVP